jgi:hypothetical protein
MKIDFIESSSSVNKISVHSTSKKGILNRLGILRNFFKAFIGFLNSYPLLYCVLIRSLPYDRYLAL